MTALGPGIRRGTKRPGKLGDVEDSARGRGVTAPHCGREQGRRVGLARGTDLRAAASARGRSRDTRQWVLIALTLGPRRHRADSSHPHPSWMSTALPCSSRKVRRRKRLPTRSRSRLARPQDTARRAAASVSSVGSGPGSEWRRPSCDRSSRGSACSIPATAKMGASQDLVSRLLL